MSNSEDTPTELADRIVAAVENKRAETDDSSRRSFLTKSAVAGGSLLALGSAAGVGMAADEHDDGGDTGNETADNVTRGEKAQFDDVEGTDVDVLNYALTLEHLEYAFYRDHLEMFSEDDFEASEAIEDYSSETDQSAYGYLETIRDHEKSHVDVLSQAVTLLGGEPVEEAQYDFGVETVAGFIGTARVFEQTGVAAYAGAAPFIESPDLLSAALSIHSVEANHWSLLNEMNGESAIPNAYNPALSQDEVLEAVGPFIVPEEPENGGNGGGNNSSSM